MVLFDLQEHLGEWETPFQLLGIRAFGEWIGGLDQIDQANGLLPPKRGIKIPLGRTTHDQYLLFAMWLSDLFGGFHDGLLYRTV